jgi:hypothetical protein
MKIKLYIFESVEDARAFEDAAIVTGVCEETEEIEKPLPKEEFKERILRKKGVRYCKKCSKPGHRSDNCPNGKRQPVFGESEDL